MPQRSHVPYTALDRHDRLIVNKLAAILRLANALDAEHLQKVQDIRLLRNAPTWILEVEGVGDLTMEQLVATARADMFTDLDTDPDTKKPVQRAKLQPEGFRPDRTSDPLGRSFQPRRSSG